MRIVYITPGTAGIFYCQNCMQDHALLKSLTALGHDVQMIPMYLPVNLDDTTRHDDNPIFYGAINIYLKERFPFYRHAPKWLERFFDSQPLLRLAAKKSGSTQAAGLEEMTVSMLQGEEGRQTSELNQLIGYLQKEIKPDIVHLSNALLLGLARSLKNELKVSVVCSLRDENEWIDHMSREYQDKIWNIMAQRAGDVDCFITPSTYYAHTCQEKMGIPGDTIRIVYDGLEVAGYELSPLPFDPPVVGYCCRMSEYFGLGILVDAFIELKSNNRYKDLKLYITGGYTREDKPFVTRTLKKLSRHGHIGDVQIFKDFRDEDRIQFLKSLTLLSVPVPGGEAFGTYQFEALASGVPVVQPNVGCFPEFVEMTKGGVIYEPNDSQTLAKTISTLLRDPARVKRLGTRGREVVLKRFSMEEMTKNMIGIYKDVLI